jgi:effector-binding domain-containing protein
LSEEPHIEHRGPQPYVAIPFRVRMQQLAGAVDQGFPELFGWLASHALTPAGPPFIRYLEVNMDADLNIEVAVPVSTDPPAEGNIRAGVLPAGPYVTLLHVGPYDGLVEANAMLQRWAQERNISWQMDGESTWRGRVERYLTDPSQERDPSTWQTEVAYLAAED